MHRLRFLENSVNARVELSPTTIHAILTRGDRRPSVITISTLLDSGRQLVAAATMLHVLARDWPGRQHVFMFPRQDDSRVVTWHLASARRVYRGPYRDALRTLMPDAWMERQAREEVDPRVSAAEAGVTLADYFFRTLDWLAERDRAQKPIRPDLKALIDSGVVRRASEIQGKPKPAPKAKPRNNPAFKFTDRALLPMMANPEEFEGPVAPAGNDIPRPYAGLTAADCPLPFSFLANFRRPVVHAEMMSVYRERAGTYPPTEYEQNPHGDEEPYRPKRKRARANHQWSLIQDRWECQEVERLKAEREEKAAAKEVQ